MTKYTWVDPIWGCTPFRGRHAQLIRSAEMIRLYGIKQLSTVYMFYPNAVHTRFHHSLGVASLIKLFLTSLPDEARKQYVSPEDEFNAVAAGLMHDLGHPAWSHVGEQLPKYFKMIPNSEILSHYEVSSRIVLGEPDYDGYFTPWAKKPFPLPRIGKFLKDEEKEKIAKMIKGEAPISETEIASIEDPTAAHNKKKEITDAKQWVTDIIRGNVDFDTADNLRRDAFYTLANPGLIDPHSLTVNIGIINTSGVCELRFLSVPFAESFLLAEELMYPAVYVESKNLIAEELLLRALIHTYNQDRLKDFWFSDDEEVLKNMKKKARRDSFVRTVLKLMMNHNTYDIAADVRLTDTDIIEDPIMKRLGDLYGHRYGLLELEKDVIQAIRKKDSSVSDGDVVVSVWIWRSKFANAKLFAHDKKPVSLVARSRLVDAMTSRNYKDSRSKCVVGTRPGMSEETRKEVKKTVFSLLKDKGYS